MKKERKFEWIEGVEDYTPARIMIFSFLYALIFGAVSLFPWMMLKDLMPELALALGMPNSRARGAIYISSTLIFGVVAFALFCVLWHKLEKNFEHKRCILITLKWSAIAAIVGVLALLAYVWIKSMMVRG